MNFTALTRTFAVATLTVWLPHVLPNGALAQVLDLRTLNTDQIRALDRSRTVVVIPGGILEEHGPYMPSYIDGYWSERAARDLAEAIAARPGWTALLFPPVPLGQGGANIIGGRHDFPGSYNLRASTLRAVYMDLADAFGEQGFRWILLMDGHGSPNHNRALNEASDYFRDTHGGMMVHLMGLMSLRACCDDVMRRMMSEEARREEGFSVHAGADEHSSALFLRPDLVSPAIKAAAPLTGGTFADLVRFARRGTWPGYFGAPARATAAHGAEQYKAESAAINAAALRILDGWDPRAERRYENVVGQNQDVKGVDDAAYAHDAQAEARQKAWLERKGLR